MNTFTINVNLDCTPRLEALLTMLLGGMRPLQKAVTVDAPKQETLEASASSTSLVPEKPQASVTPQKVKEITDADVRTHIRACREKLLSDLNGTDKANKNTMLTTLLKQKVSELGAEKATELSQDARAVFIEYCDGLNKEDLEIPF